jgi:hypothetical protein
MEYTPWTFPLTNCSDQQLRPHPPTLSHLIIMQEPTEEAEASIPTENVEEDPNLNGTFPARRKAATRTLPWDLKEEELDLVPSPPQAEDIRLTKKPRLEEPFSASLDAAATEMSSHGTAVSLPAAAAAAANHTDADLVKAIQVKVHWTLEEDAKLNSAVTSTCKKKYGKGFRIDWIAVAALVPGRTKVQCRNKWHHDLDANIAPANRRTGTWAEDEDIKLKDAVQTHGAKNWGAIAVLVPGRTKSQCCMRWHHELDPSIVHIVQVTGYTGSWTAVEDSKLQDAVQTHGGKNWAAIAALVLGRTKNQCWERRRYVLEPNINRVDGRKVKWTEDEDSKLKYAVQMHGGKNWGAIALLIPGRRQKNCYNRWHRVLDPSVDRADM